MSESLYLATLILPMATVLIVFAMRSVATVQQARARLAHDGEYRRIAEVAAAAASETASSLAVIRAAIADTSTRLRAIEEILKTVE